MAVSQDGARAVSASGDRTLKVWDLESGQEVATLRGHTDEVFSVALSSDGRRAVSGSCDGTLKVWNLMGGPPALSYAAIKMQCPVWRFGRRGRRAVSASVDGSMKVWDVEKGTEVRTLSDETSIRSLSVSRDGKRAVSGCGDHTPRGVGS